FATIWSGLEWLRGNIGTGFPWSFTGYTQTPLLPLCQIADLFGVFGVSFLLAAGNAVFLLALANPSRRRALLPSVILILALIAASVIYGLIRMSSPTTPGPRVLVIQSNFPQTNSGAKGAEEEELAA